MEAWRLSRKHGFLTARSCEPSAQYCQLASWQVCNTLVQSQQCGYDVRFYVTSFDRTCSKQTLKASCHKDVKVCATALRVSTRILVSDCWEIPGVFLQWDEFHLLKWTSHCRKLMRVMFSRKFMWILKHKVNTIHICLKYLILGIRASCVAQSVLSVTQPREHICWEFFHNFYEYVLL